MSLVLLEVNAAPADLVMKLEGSRDMIQWEDINIESMQMRDGHIRLGAQFDESQFFRIKFVNALSVARTKLLNFRNHGGQALLVEDYVDLGISGTHPTNIDSVNESVRSADDSIIASPELFQDLVMRTAEAQIDVDAAAYARRTGLEGEPLMRLSGFLRDLKQANVNPQLLFLGRSEFLARSGNIHRAVYGDDGLIHGIVANNPDGFEFDADSGMFLYSNPEALRGPSVRNMGTYIVTIPRVASVGDSSMLVSNDNWPDYRAGSMWFTNAEGRVGGSESLDGIGGDRGRNHFHSGIVYERANLCWFELLPSGTSSVQIRPGFGYNADSGRTLSNASRDFASGYLGSDKNGHERLHGEISLVLMTDAAVDKERLINGLVKHQIAGINPPSYNFLVGDSMTVGSAGAPSSRSRSPQLFVLQDSGWKGSMYDNIAEGGVPVDTQREFYEAAVERFAKMPDCGPKVIWFWGGYNDRGDYDTNTGTKALADKYVAMARDAAQRGIKTVHWSAIVSSQSSQVTFERIQLFNDYYKTQIAELEGEHIFYDHRETFAEGEFDWNTRNASYFSDSIHLSELGQQVLVADFLSRFPNP